MNTIQVPISAESASGFARVAHHHNLVITPALEMIQEVRVVTMHPSGVPMLDYIAQDQSQTDEQKRLASLRYADQFISRTTAGAFVDTATGNVVDEATAGAVSQLAYFQAITLGDLKKQGLPITDKTPFSQLLYALMGTEIKKIDTRGGF